MSAADSLTNNSLRQELVDDVDARLPGSGLFDLLAIRSADWAALARSWDDLGPDLYMADGGRYRRRRHATFACDQDGFTRMPPQPHFPSRDYNPLNGDVQRWFAPLQQNTTNTHPLQHHPAFRPH